mmetsp:Transcript_13271/g.30204  ORF Transcript_13271/g.30204 Transcript_13271/m.30204 type:complete len:493 (+) Transcript_13271:93-1571(+)
MGVSQSTECCCCTTIEPRCGSTVQVITERCSPLAEIFAVGTAEDAVPSGVSVSETRQHGHTVDRSLFLDGVQDAIQMLVTDNVGVIVSDLSGFTSTTRKHGIVHMASLIIRQRQLVLPMLHRREAIHIGFEADNLIVAFAHVHEAVLAALEMREIIARHNESLADDSVSHFRIKLNGVGVHCGTGLIIDTRGNLHGEAARGAYQLGEDVCEGGNILITRTVKDAIASHQAFVGVSFLEMEVPEEDGGGECFAVAPGCATYVFSSDANIPVPVDDGRYLHKDMLPLARRSAVPPRLETSNHVDIPWQLPTKTVLMFKLVVDSGKLLSKEAAAQFHLPMLEDQLELWSEQQALRILTPCLENGGGTAVEEALWIFSTPAEAVLATVEARRSLRNFKSSASQQLAFDVLGYGLHVGQMLFIEGTDVHWGDPVNTSSKLGQDLATNGDILISDAIMDAVRSDKRCSVLNFEERQLRRSKVNFTCFAVHDAWAGSKK